MQKLGVVRYNEIPTPTNNTNTSTHEIFPTKIKKPNLNVNVLKSQNKLYHELYPSKNKEYHYPKDDYVPYARVAAGKVRNNKHFLIRNEACKDAKFKYPEAR